MAQNDKHIVPENGYGMGYQESVEIESRCCFGMGADEFYRRQVGLVLDEIPESLYDGSANLEARKLRGDHKFPDGIRLNKKARKAGMQLVNRFDLGLGAGKKVLDLAVGEGDTSRYLATSGAHVEARELEPYLVERSREKDFEMRQSSAVVEGVSDLVRKKTSGVFGSVNYALGNYAKIKESVGDDDQFDAISCLSRSFIYLGERKNYVKALKDFYDLLAPGGKIILQSRMHIKNSDFPWSKDMGTSIGRTSDGSYCMHDERNGRKFVWRPDQRVVTLSDGVKQSIGSRYLEYADGTVKDLGQVTSDDHLDFSNLDKMGGILREAGFGNLQLKVENLSSDGAEIMFAIVAEKPDEKAVKKPSLDIRSRVLRFFNFAD